MNQSKNIYWYKDYIFILKRKGIFSQIINLNAGKKAPPTPSGGDAKSEKNDCFLQWCFTIHFHSLQLPDSLCNDNDDQERERLVSDIWLPWLGAMVEAQGWPILIIPQPSVWLRGSENITKTWPPIVRSPLPLIVLQLTRHKSIKTEPNNPSLQATWS